VSRRHSLAFTLILATIPHFNLNATTGYVDIVVAFYGSFGAVYLYLWIQDRRSVFLIVSALLTGMAAMTKNEGLVWCLINSLVLGMLLLWARRSLKLRSIIGYWSLYVSILILVWPLVDLPILPGFDKRRTEPKEPGRFGLVKSSESNANPISLPNPVFRASKLEYPLDPGLWNAADSIQTDLEKRCEMAGADGAPDSFRIYIDLSDYPLLGCAF
jgi:hypothetical protein